MYAIMLAALIAGNDVEPKGPPKGPPPEIVMAQMSGDRLVTRTTMTVVIPVVEQRVVIINGQQVTQAVTRVIPQVRIVERGWDLKKATATTAGGKKLSLEDLKKELAKPGLVIVSKDGKAIDPGFVKVFAKDAILIVAPEVFPDAPSDKKPKPDPNR